MLHCTCMAVSCLGGQALWQASGKHIMSRGHCNLFLQELMTAGALGLRGALACPRTSTLLSWAPVGRRSGHSRLVISSCNGFAGIENADKHRVTRLLDVKKQSQVHKSQGYHVIMPKMKQNVGPTSFINAGMRWRPTRQLSWKPPVLACPVNSQLPSLRPKLHRSQQPLPMRLRQQLPPQLPRRLQISNGNLPPDPAPGAAAIASRQTLPGWVITCRMLSESKVDSQSILEVEPLPKFELLSGQLHRTCSQHPLRGSILAPAWLSCKARFFTQGEHPSWIDLCPEG